MTLSAISLPHHTYMIPQTKHKTHKHSKIQWHRNTKTMTYTKTKQQPNIKLDKTKTNKSTTRVSIPNNTIQWYQPKDSSYFHGENAHNTSNKLNSNPFSSIFQNINFSEQKITSEENKKESYLDFEKQRQSTNSVHLLFVSKSQILLDFLPTSQLPHDFISNFSFMVCVIEQNFQKQNKTKQINFECIWGENFDNYAPYIRLMFTFAMEIGFISRN